MWTVVMSVIVHWWVIHYLITFISTNRITKLVPGLDYTLLKWYEHYYFPRWKCALSNRWKSHYIDCVFYNYFKSIFLQKVECRFHCFIVDQPSRRSKWRIELWIRTQTLNRSLLDTWFASAQAHRDLVISKAQVFLNREAA